MPTAPVPVLEIGGTHVTAALVDLDASAVLAAHRHPLRSAGSADEIAADVAAAAAQLDLPRPAAWGVALPGPMDYERGIGDFTGVDKFGALHGVDLGALLRDHLPTLASARFLNDADAFALGEVVDGAARGADACVFLTLGTGVGSAFVRDLTCLHDGPDVPPNGYAYLLEVDGRPIEQTFSRAALIAAYRQRTGRDVDVREIADAARAGNPDATAVFAHGYDRLAECLAPWFVRFGPEVIVVGGSIATSWGLLESHFVPALTHRGVDVPVRPAADPERSPLLGTAAHVRRVSPGDAAGR